MTFEHQWLLDRDGNHNNDPCMLNDGDTILPVRSKLNKSN